MDPQLAALAVPPYDDGSVAPPQSDVDELLRRKRKAREHKACYPCRQRKVKCDLSRPCQTCRDREHPELCNYHPPNKKAHHDSSLAKAELDPSPTTHVSPSTTDSITLARGDFDMLCRKLTSLEDSISELRREMRRNSVSNAHINGDTPAAAPKHSRLSIPHSGTHGLHTRTDKGQIFHLGSHSVPAMLLALSQESGEDSDTAQSQLQAQLGKSGLPLFGLDDESATYPFVDLWGLPHAGIQRAQELARALPQDTQMLTLLRNYRDIGYVIYPGVADFDALQADFTTFLVDRAAQSGSGEGVTEQTIYGKPYYWLALLFAVLASGTQCSDISRTERELTSQVYLCCAMECLRFSNFLSQPRYESIEALLVIGNVLTNNVNASSAWTLLGVTLRLAQGLGLHQACPPSVTPERSFLRSRIWWALVWQESLLSITYDRSASLNVETMPLPQTKGVVSPYHAAMYRLSSVMLEIPRERVTSTTAEEHVMRIIQQRAQLDAIMRDAADFLRDSHKCNSRRQIIEHFSLYLHISYTTSEICRPALSPRLAHEELLRPYRQMCIDNLANALESFLGLNSISFYARQSWGCIHRGLNSAILLAMLGEHRRDDRIQGLVGRFIAVISELAQSVDAREVSGSVRRGLAALEGLTAGGAAPGPRTTAHAASNSTNGRQSTTDDANIIPIDHSQLLSLPSLDPEAVLDDSPYSILNTILWGPDDQMQLGIES